MENKKIMVIIGLVVVVLVALTLMKKDYVSAPEEQVVVEDQTNQAIQEENVEPVELNFTEDDRSFCQPSGCELISCASGTIEDIEVAEGEVPFKCSDDSELVKQPF